MQDMLEGGNSMIINQVGIFIYVAKPWLQDKNITTLTINDKHKVRH